MTDLAIAEPSPAAIAAAADTTSPPTASSSRPPRPPRTARPPQPPRPPHHELLERRVKVIQQGDQVMLMLPSEVVKVLYVTSTGTTSLGKFGSFPTSQLIGKLYGITYELVPASTIPSSASSPAPPDQVTENTPAAASSSAAAVAENSKKGNKWKAKGKQKGGSGGGGVEMALRPMRKARMEELEETDATNDLIEDNPASSGVLTSEEIIALREQGCSAEEIMARQIERHDGFKLKTEYSKEKWKKRKEKKFSSFITPLAPSLTNIITSYATRSNSSTLLNLRIDTLSQLLNLASIRPGGRYLVVEDTGGFVVGAMLDRMGGQGRIMQITDNDSPPAWPVLEGMNFPKHITDDVVAFLNWYEAEEDYVPVQVDNAAADDAPEGTRNLAKEAAKARRRDAQLAALNRTREELHRGEWDALVVACNMSPPSVISRLTPYLAGSAGIVVYSQFQSALNETLQGMRERPEYLAPNLTESFTRRYQVLPGRTHPLMMTSSTGGYLLHATRVHPNIDLGFVRAQKHSRNKRSAPGEGRDAQRKKAKLAVGADAGESSTGTPGVESDAVDAVDDVVVEAADVTMTTE